MAGFLDEFMKTLGPQVTKQMSKNLGVSKNVTSQIVPQLVPMILGGLKKQKDERGGAARVDHILNKYGDAGVLDDIDSLFAQKANDNTVDPQLGGLLGKSGVKATDMIAKQFNLSGDIASKLIPMLAPVVLGALKQKRDAQGAGSKGIASLLDADGDGDILDDVAGFLMKGLGGGGRKQGDLLSGLLGGLLRKR